MMVLYRGQVSPRMNSMRRSRIKVRFPESEMYDRVRRGSRMAVVTCATAGDCACHGVWDVRGLRARYLSEIRRGDADHDGHSWFQRHGRGFVRAYRESSGNRDANRKWGKEWSAIRRDFSSGRDEARVIIYMYATCDEATVGRKGVKERTNIGQILLYTAASESAAIRSPNKGVARDVRDVG
jgi:hypothetical protein